MNTVGVLEEKKGEKAHPVATKKANQFGLFDLKGNVGEFISYNNNFYTCGNYRYNNKGKKNI